MTSHNSCVAPLIFFGMDFYRPRVTSPCGSQWIVTVLSVAVRPVYWSGIGLIDFVRPQTAFQILIFPGQVVIVPQCQLILALFHGFTWRWQQRRALGMTLMHWLMDLLYVCERQLVWYSWEVVVGWFTANITGHPIPLLDCCVMKFSPSLCR